MRHRPNMVPFNPDGDAYAPLLLLRRRHDDGGVLRGRRIGTQAGAAARQKQQAQAGSENHKTSKRRTHFLILGSLSNC
jgi:hypothetical protein